MDQTHTPADATPEQGKTPAAPSIPAQEQLSTITQLINDFDDARPFPAAPQPSAIEAKHQNRLVQVRLGLASSLFVALRAKHAPTAAHCLRVALGCSAWAQHLDISNQQRDELEVAALLHDVGKIGVPDFVLLKPGKLNDEEQSTIDHHRLIGHQILLSCCASQNILDIVRYAPAWFNGSKQGFDRTQRDIPLGARIVAIMDAYDAMTTDHVYRRAMSQQRAISELFEFSGSQFDTELVKHFCQLLDSGLVSLTADVARRWLHDLTPAQANTQWSLQNNDPQTPHLESCDTVDQVFHQKLLDSMHDGVVFVDTSLRILLWNSAAQKLTGISTKSTVDAQWTPTLIGMRDEEDRLIQPAHCPVHEVLRSGGQTVRRLTIMGRAGRFCPVDAHVMPVIGRDGVTYGATLLLHDASSEISLEQRVQKLHMKATMDPLTNVANRAEFDRVQAEFIQTHAESGLPCSLIICDIDHFKQVNDVYGHQAGDDALVSFAGLLRRSCRAGDLVARFGGEEFVILCADCDNATATQRADEIRSALAEIPQPALKGKMITASFGVTQVQAGDTAETMLKRADRALYQAKENGRNRVVQLGSGVSDFEAESSWFSWLKKDVPEERIVSRKLITPVPVSVAAEKLKGFVADHSAEVLSIDENQIVVLIEGAMLSPSRRGSDRPVLFHLTLDFHSYKTETAAAPELPTTGTLIELTVRPRRVRDRRRDDIGERATKIIKSVQSYLMAQEFPSD